MSKTKISVKSDSFLMNCKIHHVVSIITEDSDKYACVASDFTVRKVDYNYIFENGKVRCADVKSQ